jgi:uncharacterized protein YrrD
MENLQATKKWSDLKGMAVVALDNGKKMGSCDDFYFDLADSTIYALRVKTGMFGHQILPVADIRTIGQDAITTSVEGTLHNESDDKHLSSTAQGSKLLSYRIMSASGTVVGNVGNIILDVQTPNALRIATFELAGGLLDRISGRYSQVSISQLLRYGEDVLVISDQAAQALQAK